MYKHVSLSPSVAVKFYYPSWSCVAADWLNTHYPRDCRSLAILRIDAKASYIPPEHKFYCSPLKFQAVSPCWENVLSSPTANSHRKVWKRFTRSCFSSCVWNSIHGYETMCFLSSILRPQNEKSELWFNEVKTFHSPLSTGVAREQMV